MLNVVCLHGWGISPKFMELQTKDLRKALPFLNMHYLEAPYDVPRDIILDEKVKKYTPDNKFKTWKDSIVEDLLFQKKVDYSISVQKIVDFIKEIGGADGILGFSMGGAVVQQFFEKLEKGELDLNPAICPKFVMFVAVNYDKFINKLLTTPSVHIVGYPDFMYSANIMNSMNFLDPLFILHGEGHKFPLLNNLDIDKLVTFFAPIREKVAKDILSRAQNEILQQRPKL